MKSICIKTNNTEIIDYLLKSAEKLNIENIYISIKKFKHFNNFIIHYIGTEYIKFNTFLSNLLTKIVIEFYEENILNQSINLNFFYFDLSEKNKIIKNAKNLLNEEKNYYSKYDILNNELYIKIANSHSLYLQAFIDFNLNDYTNFLNTQLDLAVNKFLIDKEYVEFVNILKLYIKSEAENSKIEHLHLIYKNKNSIIIDDDKNIVSCNDNIKKSKYVSDITFSANDYALNTLLSLVPKKITIHLVDNYPDEFINTLLLIFQDKIKICEDCDICNMYRIKNAKTDKL